MIDIMLLAFKNLKEKKIRSWLTLIGIFIGITAVVSLIGLGAGLQAAITSQFGVSSTSVLTVQAGGLSSAGPPGTGVVNPLTFDDAEELEKVDGVEYAIPRIIQSGSLEFDDKRVFGIAMTIPDGEKRKFAYEVMDIKPEVGRLLKDGDSNKVVVGYNLYKGTNKRGEEYTWIKPGDNVLIQDKKFEVVGVTEKQGSFIFDNIIHMNEKPLKDLFDISDSVDLIAVKAKDSEDLKKVKEGLEKKLRDLRDVKEGEEDFSVETPDSAMSTVNDVLMGVNIFILMIASVSILIGALGIVNTMLTSVLERKKDIGVMKSIGSKNSHIFFLFFFESGLMGLVGGVIGTILGTIIAYIGTQSINQFFGSTAPVIINFTLIFGALLGSFLIGSISGIIPAMSAAKQNPVDSLRG